MFKKKSGKIISVTVSTAESQLEFDMSKSALGKELFDQIVRTIGLRETWFFGIQYNDKYDSPTWLRMDKKISAHDMDPNKPYHFKFLVKFYPENVTEELILGPTIRHFYLQVKNDISSKKIYCPTEACVLLASYACVVKFGMYIASRKLPALPIDRLIPGHEQYAMTDAEWNDRIISYYKDHPEMTREAAMLEYLKVAEDLEMYGVETFPIKNKKGTDLILGVDALGLNIYEPDNMLEPKIGFPWSELCNLSFHDKKFSIKPVDKNAKEFFFVVEKSRINKNILALCQGNHDLYMRRRKTDSIEVQQMKTQAEEEKRAFDQERSLRKEAELKQNEDARRLEELSNRMLQREHDLEALTKKISNYESKVTELENLLRQEREERAELLKNQQLLTDMNKKLKEETAASSEEKSRLEAERDRMQKAVREQEAALQRKEEEKAKTEKELERLKIEKEKEQAEQAEKEKLMAQGDANQDDHDGACDFGVVENMSRPEESRTTLMSKDSDLKTRQTNLKSELNRLRDETKMENLDHRHEFNVRTNTDKYKTLRNIRKGNTMTRVEQFECM